MKIYTFLILVFCLVANSCTNPNAKEIEEVDALLTIINDTEMSLLSIDTGLVFGTKRQMEMDIEEISNISDTITREEAFKLDDIFRSKKGFNTITNNYNGFLREIDFSKKQLNNLKQDLENGLMKEEDFKINYALEEEHILMLNGKIGKALNGLNLAIEKHKSDRPLLLEIIENKKLKAAANE